FSYVIEYSLEWMELSSWVANNYHVTSPMEDAELIMHNLFSQYPVLKPSTDQDVIELKKCLLDLLSTSHERLEEIFGGRSTGNIAFDRFL
ncbi:hypothetical protein PENTCL1PPCAC_3579, partial [Pristionchus entomophagus]